MRRKSFLKSCFLIVISLLIFYSCHHDSEKFETPFFPEEPSSTKNIEYGRAADTSGNMQSLLFDIYFPAIKYQNQKFPLVVLIHHGSYLLFDKSVMGESAQILADSGFVTVCIDYRLGWRLQGGCEGDTHTLALAEYRGIQDANASLRFLVANSYEYKIDTNWIFVGGLSAGASIALNSSFATDSLIAIKHPDHYSKLGSLFNSGNYYSIKYTIKGIFNSSGAISDTNYIQLNKKIPVLCFHGTEDDLVPFSAGYFLGCKMVPAFGSQSVYRRLIATNSICVLHQKTGGSHMPWDYRPVISTPLVAEFFKQVIQGKAKSAIIIE